MKRNLVNLYYNCQGDILVQNCGESENILEFYRQIQNRKTRNNLVNTNSQQKKLNRMPVNHSIYLLVNIPENFT